ncbi:hypothetical protein M8494_03720 [Serratia ureilytica]
MSDGVILTDVPIKRCLGQRSRLGHAWREPPESPGPMPTSTRRGLPCVIATTTAGVEQYPLKPGCRWRDLHRCGSGSRQVDDPDSFWVHRLRSLIITDAQGQPELLALILSDATEWASAEQRFENLQRQSGAGGHLSAKRPALRQGQPRFSI